MELLVFFIFIIFIIITIEFWGLFLVVFLFMVMVNVLYPSLSYIYLELALNGAAVLQYIVVNTSFFFFFLHACNALMSVFVPKKKRYYIWLKCINVAFIAARISSS